MLFSGFSSPLKTLFAAQNDFNLYWQKFAISAVKWTSTDS